jgi:hypothetical protein
MKNTHIIRSLIFFASVCLSQASVTVVWSNNGDDVVASYSGTLDLTGYSSGSFFSDITGVTLGPSLNIFWGNVPRSDSTHFTKQFDAYVDSGLMVPYIEGPVNGAEQAFGFYTEQDSFSSNLYVPPGYVSGTEIEGQAVFAYTTVFDIFGTDVFDTTVFNDGANTVTFSSVPEPSSVLLSFFGLSLVLLWHKWSGSLRIKTIRNTSRWRRRRAFRSLIVLMRVHSLSHSRRASARC